MKYLCNVILRGCSMWIRPIIWGEGRGGSHSQICHAIQKAFLYLHFTESNNLTKELPGLLRWLPFNNAFLFLFQNTYRLYEPCFSVVTAITSLGHKVLLFKRMTGEAEEMALWTTCLSWKHRRQN